MQTFYFWRIYKLSRRMWPSIFGVLLSWLRCAGWFVFAVAGSKQGYFSVDFVDEKSWLLITLIVCGLVTNGGLSGVMVYYLVRKRPTPFPRYVTTCLAPYSLFT